MKDKSYFIRPDILTYKKKFLLLCAEKQIKTENFVQRFGNMQNKNYIRRIEIKEKL
jgi:hypothetical protein